MTTTTTRQDTDVVLLLAFLTAEAVLCIVRDLLLPLVALAVTLATLRQPVPRVTPPAPAAPAARPIDSLPVRELRQLARTAGHRQLARNGRRQQLLEVLA